MSLPANTLQKLLDQTQTHPKIKQTLKLLTQARQKITYHALISSSQTYLHLRGLINNDQQQFNYINKILHSKIVGVLGKIKRKQLNVRDFQQQTKQQIQQKIKQQNAVNQQLIAEVQYVINNVDLPLSLFKRNDHYWYHDNPKTVQAKNYVHNRIRQEKQRKNRVRSQMIKKQTQKQKQERQIREQQQKAQQQRRRKHRQQIQAQIQNRRKISQERQKNIVQSQKYISSLKPLFMRIHEHDQKSKVSALQQQKKRLSQLRKLHKSIDISEIQEHKNKLIQLQKQRQIKKIINQPLKVSYKSQYHTSMTARSRINQYQSTKSLYDKKKQYALMIKNQFKPQINEALVSQMEERLKLMKRKRARKNPKKKQQKKRDGGEDDDDEDYDDEDEVQQEKPQQVKKPQPPQNNNEQSDENQDSDEDEENKKPPRRIRGQDEDPDRTQRYQMGVGYLQYVRNLKKKNKQQKRDENQNNSKIGENNSQFDKQGKGKTSHRYKDYLKQFVKTNRSTIDHIDTQRMKNQYNKSIITKDNDSFRLSKLQNQTRMVSNKIHRQQQLLKHRKMKNQEAIAKKVQIDNAVIQTIKARLALMGN